MSDIPQTLPTPEPLATLVASTDEAPVNDTWTVRIVTLLLGTIALAVVIGAVILAAMAEDPLPGEITTIGAGAAGALGGLLASTASRRT